MLLTQLRAVGMSVINSLAQSATALSFQKNSQSCVVAPRDVVVELNALHPLTSLSLSSAARDHPALQMYAKTVDTLKPRMSLTTMRDGVVRSAKASPRAVTLAMIFTTVVAEDGTDDQIYQCKSTRIYSSILVRE